MHVRPFRFGVVTEGAQTGAEWKDKIRKAEDLGFSSILVADHPGAGMAPIAAIATAVVATTSIRVGSFVFNTDIRNPVLLAQEIIALAAISEGRFELGLGAGYLAIDYEQTGVPFENAGKRLSRFEEALHIIKSMLTEESTTFSGNFYSVVNAKGRSSSVPQVPIYIGGGGKRVLQLAAREADIVGFVPRNHAKGLDMQSATAEATAQKVEWVREAAGDRFSQLELSSMVFVVVISNDRDHVAQQMGRQFGLSPAQTLGASHVLIGTVDQIVDELLLRRERYGISYIEIHNRNIDVFAPIVARLADK
jgi:probable F420-dependent oxidoreductase